jgi:hypothetical protein
MPPDFQLRVEVVDVGRQQSLQAILLSLRVIDPFPAGIHWQDLEVFSASSNVSWRIKGLARISIAHFQRGIETIGLIENGYAPKVGEQLFLRPKR